VTAIKKHRSFDPIKSSNIAFDLVRGVGRAMFRRCYFVLILLAVFFVTVEANARTIRWARSGDAMTFDPDALNEGATAALTHHIYETLVWRDAEGKLVPQLALSWQILPSDPAIWEFKLRPNVKFHDGTPMTADDVVFSLDRARLDNSDFKGLHSAVESVRKVDDLTVQVKTKGPAPLYVNNLTNTFIMSKKWAEEHGVQKPQDYKNKEENYAVRNTNGTGPYILVSRDPEVKTVLKVNPDHWAEQKPEVTEIIYTPIKSDATRIAALLSGEVDFVEDVPAQDIERLRQTPGIKVITGAENRTIFFMLDQGSKELRSSNIKGKNPFADVRVRKAMNLVLDRDAIKRVVMRGQSVPTNTIVPIPVNGWTKELDAYPKPDIEQAKKLMEEAGYKDGFSVNLNCPNDRYVNDEAICQAYVGMLGRIGIKTTLISQSKVLHFPIGQKGEADFFMMGWGVPPYDSGYIFDYLVHTRSDQPGGDNEESLGGWNVSHYSNPDIDKKIVELHSEVDLAKRDRIIAEIWKKLQDEQVFIAVHNQVKSYAMKENVNIAVNPEDIPNMAMATFTKTQ
jgi:peptide/nickel transport system substrate-binding protein